MELISAHVACSHWCYCELSWQQRNRQKLGQFKYAVAWESRCRGRHRSSSLYRGTHRERLGDGDIGRRLWISAAARLEQSLRVEKSHSSLWGRLIGHQNDETSSKMVMDSHKGGLKREPWRNIHALSLLSETGAWGCLINWYLSQRGHADFSWDEGKIVSFAVGQAGGKNKTLMAAN